MKTRNQPRKNYKDPSDDESTLHSSQEREYNSESTETDGSMLSQDRNFIANDDTCKMDPDAAYTLSQAPIYVSSDYTDDFSDVIFIEKRKIT